MTAVGVKAFYAKHLECEKGKNRSMIGQQTEWFPYDELDWMTASDGVRLGKHVMEVQRLRLRIALSAS